MCCKSIGIDLPDGTIISLAEAFKDNKRGARELLFKTLSDRIDRTAKFFIKTYEDTEKQLHQNLENDKDNDEIEMEL
jgi:hypothetical protein